MALNPNHVLQTGRNRAAGAAKKLTNILRWSQTNEKAFFYRFPWYKQCKVVENCQIEKRVFSSHGGYCWALLVQVGYKRDFANKLLSRRRLKNKTHFFATNQPDTDDWEPSEFVLFGVEVRNYGCFCNNKKYSRQYKTNAKVPFRLTNAMHILRDSA